MSYFIEVYRHQFGTTHFLCDLLAEEMSQASEPDPNLNGELVGRWRQTTERIWMRNAEPSVLAIFNTPAEAEEEVRVQAEKELHEIQNSMGMLSPPVELHIVQIGFQFNVRRCVFTSQCPAKMVLGSLETYTIGKCER